MRTFLVLLALPLAVVALSAGTATSDDSAAIQWDHDSYASLSEAAADAKQKNRRLLIGLSGGAAC